MFRKRFTLTLWHVAYVSEHSKYCKNFKEILTGSVVADFQVGKVQLLLVLYIPMHFFIYNVFRGNDGIRTN